MSGSIPLSSTVYAPDPFAPPVCQESDDDVILVDVLKACGENAVRATANRATLDAAQREGQAVMANLPVRGERNGLDWGNAEQVEEQKRKVLAVVREWQNHPALMFWSVGNELDHIPGKPSYHPQLWDRLFVTAVDGQGHVAYGNIPFLVAKE